MSYEIVKYRAEFKEEAVQLQTHLWSSDFALNAAYLGWKHERNPYVAEPLIYLALSKGQLVGMRAMFGAQWQVGGAGQTLVGLCAGDLVIAPEHRSQGVFPRIMQFACDDLLNRGYTYMFNLSAGSITYLSSLATGWRGIGSLKPVRWTGAHRRPEGPDVCRNFDCLDTHAGRCVGSPVVVEATPRPQAMAELIGRIGDDGRLRHVRDEQYFGWRFGNPRSTYRFLYWGLGRLEGYLVLRRPVDAARARRGSITIVDWEAATTAVRAGLLQAATEWGNFHRLTVWSATLPGDVKEVLRDYGFTPVETRGVMAASRPTMLVRPLRKELLQGEWSWGGRRLLDLANWDLRMIYSDGA